MKAPVAVATGRSVSSSVAVARTKAIVEGNPLDPKTMIGAQASNDQLEKILSYFDIGRKEGAKVLTGGERRVHPGELAGGYYVQPTILAGHNKMRVFQEEIFGPVVSVTNCTPWKPITLATPTLCVPPMPLTCLWALMAPRPRPH